MSYQKELSLKQKQRLDTLYEQLKEHKDQVGGYPCNLDFDYSELYRFLEFHINNIGDPQGYSNYKLNTHDIERDVLAFFADLLGAGGDYHGYVTSGGTEGNFFGLHLANQLYPDGIVYYSDRSHYSILKILKIINARRCRVPSLPNGEIDYNVLQRMMAKNHYVPVIIAANIGTTMTGAIDNIVKIQQVIQTVGIKESYIHGDAALSGLILPFVDKPPAFRFSDGIDSIAISGHKLLGSPMPCGIALTQQKLLDEISPKIAYVKIIDNTLTSSRNGITPLMMWYAIARSGKEGMRKMIKHCLTHVKFTVDTLRKHGVAAWSNPHSITVVLPRPCEAIIEKWQLAPYEDIVHIMIMPQATKKSLQVMLDDIIKDLTPSAL